MKIFALLYADNRILDIVSEETPDFSTFNLENLFELTQEDHLRIWKDGNNANWKVEDGKIIYDPLPEPEIPEQTATFTSAELPKSIL